MEFHDADHHEDEEKKLTLSSKGGAHDPANGLVNFHRTLNIAQLPSIKQYLEQSKTQFEIKQNEYAMVSRGGVTLTVYPRRIVPADEDSQDNCYGQRMKDYAIVTSANGEECCRFTNDKIPKRYCYLYSNLWQLVQKVRKKTVMYRLIRTDRGMGRITCLVSLAQTLSVEWSSGAVVFLADVHNSEKFLFKSSKEQSMRDVPWSFNVQDALRPFEFDDKYDKMVRKPLHEFAHVMRALLKQGHQTQDVISSPYRFEWNADHGYPSERLRPPPVEVSPVDTSVTDASSQQNDSAVNATIRDISHICQQLQQQMAIMASDIKLIKQTQQQQQHQQEINQHQAIGWDEKKQEIAAMISKSQMKQQQNVMSEMTALKREFSSVVQTNAINMKYISHSVVSEIQPVIQEQMDCIFQKIKSANADMCSSIIDSCRRDGDNRIRAHQKTLKKHLQQIAKNLNELHEADVRFERQNEQQQQLLQKQQKDVEQLVNSVQQQRQCRENLQQWMDAKMSKQHSALEQMLSALPRPPRYELKEMKKCLLDEVNPELVRLGAVMQDVRSEMAHKKDVQQMERHLMQRIPKENENEHEAKTSEETGINTSPPLLPRCSGHATAAKKLQKHTGYSPPRRFYQPIKLQLHSPPHPSPSPKKEHEIIDIGDPQLSSVQKPGTLRSGIFVLLVMVTAGWSLSNLFM